MSERYKLHLGDCLEVLKTLPDGSVDAVITDPPYGLSFMGKRWDASVPSVEVWAECLRVAKPGAHLLSFAGTRTQHRMAVAIEDAGWFIRDMIAWVYSSGFPKSLDVSKSIDKAAGAEREVVGRATSWNRPNSEDGHRARMNVSPREYALTAPATPEAQQWAGWGTALKPALEPITLARKPIDGTVAANVLEHGTGALNIDGCRVESGGVHGSAADAGAGAGRETANQHGNALGKGLGGIIAEPHPAGRWPANLIHDGSDEVVGLFPVTPPAKASMRGDRTGVNTDFSGGDSMRGHNDNGGNAARFFYCAKASKADRDEDNFHPTVKPTDLMRYLCRLITPPGGVVLDPFMGSGSTGKAAMLEGLRFIGIELEPDYMEIAKRRIEREAAQRTLDFGGEA